MYYKGANMLHTIRQVINDDEKWRQVLRGLNKEFYHQTVTTKQIEDYMSKTSGVDLSKIFDQYLRTPKVPVFEYKTDGTLKYRYTDVVKGFKMPLKIVVDDEIHWITPSKKWKTEKIKGDLSSLKVDRNFYVETKEIGN